MIARSVDGELSAKGVEHREKLRACDRCIRDDSPTRLVAMTCLRMDGVEVHRSAKWVGCTDDWRCGGTYAVSVFIETTDARSSFDCCVQTSDPLDLDE